MGKMSIAALITAVVGLGDSVYLSWAKLSHTDIICIQGDLTDCNLVNSSSYSEWQGIPISLLGVAGYLLLILFILASGSKGRIGGLATLGFFGISAFGVIYSAYLTYVEIFILKALCQWCLVSAIAMAVLFAIALVKVMKSNTLTNML